MDYGIPIPNSMSLKCTKEKNKHHYVFYNNECDITCTLEGKPPLSVTTRQSVGREIMNHINASVKKGEVDKNKSGNMFKNILNQLNEYVDNYNVAKQLIDREKRLDAEREDNEKIEQVMEWYKGFDEPLLWIACQIEWLTAGERGNIIKSFLAFCSQIILKHPISLIGLGEGSSGKDHVRTIARGICPEEFFVDEKQPTLASMFRRSTLNPHYYDGKIVCYGDLGGENDQDEVRQTKDILKEMQSDGYVNRPITVATDGDFEVVDLELFGFPALNFTTVPNYTSDSQELSSSLLITPRTDNRRIFFDMMHLLEFEGSPIYIAHEKIKEELYEKIPLVVKGLRKQFDDIVIVNPYSRNVERFLGHSEYFKRDYKKFNSLLKVISVFNYNTKEIFHINGNKTIFVDKYDLALFFSIFNDQMHSISSNLSPKAANILNDLEKNFLNYAEKSEYNHPEVDGVTVNEYHELVNNGLSKRSLRRYFKELYINGYVKPVGVYNRSNIYAPTEKDEAIPVAEETLDMDSITVKQLCMAYGEEICDKVQQDPAPIDCSIFNNHQLSSIPPWSVKQ